MAQRWARCQGDGNNRRCSCPQPSHPQSPATQPEPQPRTVWTCHLGSHRSHWCLLVGPGVPRPGPFNWTPRLFSAVMAWLAWPLAPTPGPWCRGWGRSSAPAWPSLGPRLLKDEPHPSVPGWPCWPFLAHFGLLSGQQTRTPSRARSLLHPGLRAPSVLVLGAPGR